MLSLVACPLMKYCCVDDVSPECTVTGLSPGYAAAQVFSACALLQSMCYYELWSFMHLALGSVTHGLAAI